MHKQVSMKETTMQKQTLKPSQNLTGPVPNPPVQQASIPRLIAEIFVRVFERRPAEEHSLPVSVVLLVLRLATLIFLIYLISKMIPPILF
ncbi:MAG: hypothetical protein MJE68_26140 [Proteobacteria bacterium]|nr:hypothetical protein [Pseudomonadota bacterium]